MMMWKEERFPFKLQIDCPRDTGWKLNQSEECRMGEKSENYQVCFFRLSLKEADSPRVIVSGVKISCLFLTTNTRESTKRRRKSLAASAHDTSAVIASWIMSVSCHRRFEKSWKSPIRMLCNGLASALSFFSVLMTLRSINFVSEPRELWKCFFSI